MKHYLLSFALSLMVFGQILAQVQVTGKVSNSSGEAIPGVNVTIKGTSQGTITDIDGEYTLMNVPSDGTLIYSYVGMTTQEVAVGSRSRIDVALAEDVQSLQEIVVIGYGAVKKEDLTGAVSSIGNKELVSRGTTSPIEALQSNVAGVNITRQSGNVGSDFEIQIRGVNSLTGAQPLFVVDGVVTDNINWLNPNDIDRIDILKDASSTAIYGSRGSNGVVIVTTRSGERVKGRQATFQYSGYVGMRTIANMPDFLNGYDEAVVWNKDREVALYLVQGRDFNADPDWDTFGFPNVEDEDGNDYWAEALSSRRGTDWLDVLLKPSIQQNHFISASGGSDDISYMVGAGYQGDDGNAEGQWYKKYNFKASVDGSPSDKFSMGANINLAFSDRELIATSYVQQLFRMPTWAPARNTEGDLVQSPMVGISGNVNPYAHLENGVYNVEDYYVISNFYVRFTPFNWLTLRSTFSPNARFQRRGEYQDEFATRSISVGRMWNDNNLSFLWDNQLSLSKDFGNHSLTYDFIQSAQSDRFEGSFVHGRILPFNSQFYNVESGDIVLAESDFRKSTLLSFTNRLNYSLMDKYLFTATMRWDGSSRMAPGNKWAAFPSAAIAWRMSEEPFFANSQVDNLKLRLSYGLTGNNNINPYLTMTRLDRQTYYDWDGTTANGFIPSSIPNPNLTWERTREWNLGADFSFFRNRVSGEVNVYDRLSLDLLMSRKLPMPTGWAEMMDNVGSVSNKGVEVQLSTVNVEAGDFSWETTFTYAMNNNKIVELYGKKEDDVPNRWFIGEPVEVVYAMVFDGIWQRDELAEGDRQEMEGTAKVKDLNEDGNIDIDNDMTVLGSPIPKWTGSISTTLRYRNFDLSASVYTKQGVFIFSPFHREFTDFNSRVILDVPYYVRENPITESRFSNTYPQARYMGPYWGEDAEDYGYPGFNKDASFTRIQNITLGYTMPQNLMSRLGVSNMRVYLNALNPFVFTKYDGFDPEWAGASMSGVEANNTSYSIYQIGTTINF